MKNEISCATCLLASYNSQKIGKKYQTYCKNCDGYPDFKLHVMPSDENKKEWNYKDEGYTNKELMDLCK
jgi:hypothetical protein